MRYICDFNPDLLLRVLPDFGLSIQERRQVISSAIGRPRKSQIPVTLQSAIAICEKEHSIGTTAKVEKSTDLPLPELPRLLRLICKRLPADYQPAMIIAALPVLGTLATRIRFEYLDRQEHSLSFFSCITAPAASGKSFIRKPLDLLLTPINEQDAIEREKEQAYKEKMRASKNSKNQPEDPHACPRNNGVAISIAKKMVDSVNSPEQVQEVFEGLKRLDHALTSEKEATAMLKARCKELDIVFDKNKKAYVYRVHES